jgi:hypothetical protein
MAISFIVPPDDVAIFDDPNSCLHISVNCMTNIFSPELCIYTIYSTATLLLWLLSVQAVHVIMYLSRTIMDTNLR